MSKDEAEMKSSQYGKKEGRMRCHLLTTNGNPKRDDGRIDISKLGHNVKARMAPYAERPESSYCPAICHYCVDLHVAVTTARHMPTGCRHTGDRNVRCRQLMTSPHLAEVKTQAAEAASGAGAHIGFPVAATTCLFFILVGVFFDENGRDSRNEGQKRH